MGQAADHKGETPLALRHLGICHSPTKVPCRDSHARARSGVRTRPAVVCSPPPRDVLAGVTKGIRAMDDKKDARDEPDPHGIRPDVPTNALTEAQRAQALVSLAIQLLQEADVQGRAERLIQSRGQQITVDTPIYH